MERIGPLVGGSGRQQEFVRTTVVSRARHLSLLGDHDEAESFQFVERWADRCAVDAIFGEIIERDGELPVVLAAVMRPFDLDARQDAVS